MWSRPEIVVVFIHRELVVEGARHLTFSDIGDFAVLYADLVDNRAGLVGFLPTDCVLLGSPETIEDCLPLGFGQGVEVSRNCRWRDGNFCADETPDSGDTATSTAGEIPADPLLPIPIPMGCGGTISLPPFTA